MFYSEKWNFFKKLGTLLNPFAPDDFAEKHVLKLVEQFCGHRRAVMSWNLPQSRSQVVHFNSRPSDPHAKC